MSKQTNSSVADAEAIVRDLEAKRTQHVQKGTELANGQAAIAYSAHTAGDASTKKRLAEIERALSDHATELRSLDAAVSEAQGRVATARAAEAEEQDRANAKAIRQVVKALGEHASVADDALHDLILAGTSLKECLDRLHQLGVASPRHEALQVLGHNALLTALMQSPWKRYFEPVAPNARRDFAGTIASWSSMIENGISARLGEAEQQQKEKADAAA